jgi:hypothetical protein
MNWIKIFAIIVTINLGFNLALMFAYSADAKVECPNRGCDRRDS